MRERLRGLVEGRVVLVLCAVVVLVRLPFLGAPLTADEAGYLTIGGQWHAGTSLYGDYWVDRPPLLIELFRLAQVSGGAVPLRILGTIAVVLAVVLAGRLGRSLAPGTDAPAYAAVTCALFAATPVVGSLEVNGEILALPFVLGGLLALVAGVRAARSRSTFGWWALAGVLGACAALIKQSEGDVALVALAVLLVTRRRVLASLAGITLGGLAALGAGVGWAAWHGTDLPGLYDAVVSFRFAAAHTISTYGKGVSNLRLIPLVAAFVLSGAPVVVGVVAVRLRRRGADPVPTPDPRVIAVVLLVWELIAVAFGGSYWRHYLIGLVPGLVVGVTWVVWSVAHAPDPTIPARPHVGPRRREPLRALGLLRATYVWAGVLALGATCFSGWVALDQRHSPEQQVADYLDAHRQPGDQAMVAFGRSNLLYMAGMSSPYQELWSLPVRVRDPHLSEFTAIMASPRRPAWVVVAGATLYTWGLVDYQQAEVVLARDYHQVAAYPGYLVMEADSRSA